MKFTSLNLFGYFNDWQSRLPHILNYLSEEKPAVIFFQEVVYLPDTAPRPQAYDVLSKLDYTYQQLAVTRLQGSPHHSEYREGLAAASRFPITHAETLVLRQHPDDHLQRIVQLLDINVNGHTVKFANIHFAEKFHHAEIHFLELLDILKSREDYNRIIVGDFNMPDLATTADHWQQNYRSSGEHAYISYPSKNYCIDYALIPKTAGVNMAVSTSSDLLSDHRAVTFALSPTA
ncbi:hypothetical protein FJZ39_03370 [Candidatus Saccharibacteria bacterium]|nr:hypothetical protein [Candidatus Saccharibacteria bacterium]